MRKFIYFQILIAALGISLISCSSPSPRGIGRESKGSEPINEQNVSSSFDDTTEYSIELDRINENQARIADSLAGDELPSSSIDDYIWQRLTIAQEYCTMGITANREASWEEAEYYFEKSLSTLGELDIDTESDSLSEESIKYNRLLAEIVASYRTTLVSLGRLSSDISPDVLIARFSDINHFKIDSSEYERLETYAQEKESYNVPVVLNERVKTCIIYYQTAARDAIRKYLSRSTKYIPMITRILREYGLPTDLVYLALVESGYNPHAYSWARAMGMWQFIASTGRLYNLERTWWYDERKDPVKATHAAARFLKDLYDEFGSWELALAAYNGGPGRVRNTTKKQNTQDFWKLRLKKQTMDYVPFFMAASMICKNPERFGFSEINYEPEWKFDVVRIDRSIELKAVADALNCPVSSLQELNPELLRQFTPPNKKHYDLRIPPGTEDQFWAAYDGLPAAKQTSWAQHKVRRGETVASIARKYGISEYAILEANNLSRRAKLTAGRSIIIPVPSDRTYAGTSPTGSRNYRDDDGSYTVRSGDTVSDIARAFKMTPDEIRRINNLNRRSQIFVGQKLLVKPDPSQIKENPSSNPSGEMSTYIVRAGDTVWEIARRFGISVASLRKLNNLGSQSQIYPGQKLLISRRDSGSSYKTYTVKQGDTIYAIANFFNTTVARILSWNDLSDPRLIRAGEQLIIYSD